MNLYFVERTDPVRWDEYQSYVVAAETAVTAIKSVDGEYHDTWEGLTVKLIGVAECSMKRGEVIATDFNGD